MHVLNLVNVSILKHSFRVVETPPKIAKRLAEPILSYGGSKICFQSVFDIACLACLGVFVMFTGHCLRQCLACLITSLQVFPACLQYVFQTSNPTIKLIMTQT
jgi:hypothetical protein